MKVIEKDGKFLGIVNEIIVSTLLSKTNKFAAAIPCEYHGIKRSYHKTENEAVKWVENDGR